MLWRSVVFEQIPLLLATPIAKIVLDKFYEGTGSKLGEKAVELAVAPIQKLGQVIWERLCSRSSEKWKIPA